MKKKAKPQPRIRITKWPSYRSCRLKHKGLKKISYDRLTAVAREMAKRPRQVNMGVYLSGYNGVGCRAPECGTAGCIQGFGWALFGNKGRPFDEDKPLAAVASSREENWGLFYDTPDGTDTFRIGALKENGLFFVSDWPKSFANQYDKAQSRGSELGLTRVTIDRIAHFLKTGK